MTRYQKISLLSLLFIFVFAVHLWFFLAIQLPQRSQQEDVYPGSQLFHLRLFGDEAHFAFIAYHLNTQGLYSIDGKSPTALRLPLFPLVLALIYRFTDHNACYGIVFNCLVTAGIALATYFLAALFWDPGTALAAMAVAGLSPNTFDSFIHHGCTALFTLGLICSLIFFIQLNRRPSLGRACLCGLATGAAALTRAEGVLLVLLYGAYLIWRHFFKGQHLLKPAAAVLVVSLTLLAPWVVRNGLSLHYWGLSTMSGEVFAGAHNRRILDRHPGSWGRFSSFAPPEEMQAVAHLNEVQLSRYLWQRGLKTMREYSLPYLFLVEGKKLFNTFKPSFRLLPKGYHEFLNLLLVAPFFVLYLLFFVFLGRTLKEGAGILLLPFALPLVVTLLFWGTTRWRIPLEPIMFSVSLAGLINLWQERPRSAWARKPV